MAWITSTMQNEPSGGTSSKTSSTSSSTDNIGKRGTHMRKVSNSRLLFLACLAGVAALLGAGSYSLLSNSEAKLAEEQFEAIADRALDMSLDIALRKRHALFTMATIIEQAFPDAKTWPFIDLNGFEAVSNSLMKTASGDAMGLLPVVTPEQREVFQDWAKDLYPETGVTTVTGLDANFQRYNETDGETYWGSPYKIFTPFLYHSKGPLLFLANYHSIESRGRELDDVIACSEKRAKEIRNNEGREDYLQTECSTVTSILDLAQGTKGFDPASVLYKPIYPAHNISYLAGFITSTIKWRETLIGVFSREVSGVHCVLKTETQVYTYQVTNGNVTLRGEGDLHNDDFSHYGRTIALNSAHLYSSFSPNYTLSIYPTHELFDVYATTNPCSATVGSVGIVILTACIFFLYDFFVRKELNHKDELDMARRQFVRFISHEVRTPLNAVCMGLQLQQGETDRLTKLCQETNDSNAPATPSEKGDEMEGGLIELSSIGHDILNNANSAVGVLNDLLNYDKVESGTLHLELTVVNVWELIHQTFSEFQTQAQFNNTNYILDLSAFEDEEAPVTAMSQLPQDIKNRKVVGDKVRISQVIRNLISNALKFSKEKGTLTVRPSWKNRGQQSEQEITLHSGETAIYLPCGDLQIEVADTGSGMTKDQLKRLFREGVQFNVNELQAGQGSGLGLYIAKGILEQHGGSLTAASEGIGCGTVFTMTLPLYYVPDPPDPEGPVSSARRLRTDLCEKLEPMKILVVDDIIVNRKLLARLLQKQGHVCDQAEDGFFAVQSVKDIMKEGKRYDAILMDYEMPRMNGPTAAKQIRALGSDSFIVGITGNLFPEDISIFEACGANLVLPKPLDLHALTDAFVEHRLSMP